MVTFNTASNVKRPKRLNNAIRAWAYESLMGKYGSEAKRTPYIEITSENFNELNDIDKYDYSINEIAKNAPIRVCDEELVSGSATLGGAIFHEVPAKYNGKAVFSSVSHLTIDYKTSLDKGVDYYEEVINAKLLQGNLNAEEKRFLISLLNVISSMRIYHKRYLKAVEFIKPKVYENLLQVPFKPARNFYEAVQSIWFIFLFLRLTGNWPGIGRLDWLVGSYLKADLKNGSITKTKAREILASLFIKGTEWIEKDTPLCSGDAQHYQNIVLGGIDENGVEVTNEVTYLVLDLGEELGISDFPITVRVNSNTPKKLLNKMARVIRHGGGVVAVYNENVVIKGMVNYGYNEKEARNFANDGCWETQIPGATRFGYMPFDSLALLQKVTLNRYENVNFNSFSELFSAYVKDLNGEVKEICNGVVNNNFEDRNLGVKKQRPCSVVSLFINGCIDNAKSYYELGPKYNIISPHIGGIVDTVNALYAIKKLVFDDKIITFSKFLTALKNDWQGCEEIRAKAKLLKYYGTDNDEVDSIYCDIINEFYLACKRCDTHKNLKFPAGVSTFGREIEWGKSRLATPFGSKKGDILSSNSSPTPSTDTDGVTAVIKSYAKADLTKMVTGTALDVKLSPSAFTGVEGLNAIKSLINGFVALGGYFMQIDSVSAETLKKARENPAEFKTLSVRVSGWNARFVTLTKEWQDMIIQRTEHNE